MKKSILFAILICSNAWIYSSEEYDRNISWCQNLGNSWSFNNPDCRNCCRFCDLVCNQEYSPGIDGEQGLSLCQKKGVAACFCVSWMCFVPDYCNYNNGCCSGCSSYEQNDKRFTDMHDEIKKRYDLKRNGNSV